MGLLVLLQILGGTPDTDHSGVVAVELGQSGAALTLCSGILVDARTVVTAAHCVNGHAAADLQVLVGARAATPDQTIAVTQTVVQPWFTGVPSDAWFAVDLAVLSLAADASATPIPYARDTVAGPAEVVGFGLDDPNVPTSSGIRRVAQVTTTVACDRLLSFGDGVVSACVGDSGGAVIAGGQAVALISFGSSSDCGAPVYAVQLAPFARWLDSLRSAQPDPMCTSTCPPMRTSCVPDTPRDASGCQAATGSPGGWWPLLLLCALRRRWLAAIVLAGCGGDPGRTCAPSTNPDGTVVLATGQNVPTEVALDAVNVYWVSYGDGAVAFVPKAGGCFTTLTVDGAGATGIAVDGDSVFFTNSQTGAVKRVGRSDRAVQVLASGQGKPTRILATDDRVFWLNEGLTSSTGQVMSVARAGGDPVVIADGQRVPKALATDGTSLLWANGGDLRLWKAPLGGGPAAPFADAGSGPIDAFTSGDQLVVGYGDSVATWSITTGAPGWSYGTTGLRLVRMAVAGGRAFFTSLDGKLSAVTIGDNSGFSDVVTGLPRLAGLAVDDGAIYFAETGSGSDGAIVKRPR